MTRRDYGLPLHSLQCVCTMTAILKESALALGQTGPTNAPSYGEMLETSGKNTRLLLKEVINIFSGLRSFDLIINLSHAIFSPPQGTCLTVCSDS